MGPDLYQVFKKAGLPPPAMHMEIPLGCDAEFALIFCQVLVSLLPHAYKSGVSPEALGDLTTLPQRVQAEVAASNSVVSFLPLVGAWSRRPQPPCEPTGTRRHPANTLSFF